MVQSMHFLVACLVGIFSVASAIGATAINEITLQVTSEELGLECMSLHGTGSSEFINKFLLRITVGFVEDVESPHNISHTIPRVHLSVVSSTGKVIQSIVLKDENAAALAVLSLNQNR